MAARDFFTDERGIQPWVLDAYGIGSDGDKIVIPYGELEKYRVQDGEKRRIWWSKKGVHPPMFVSPFHEMQAKTAFIVEGESDAMRLWQELKGVSPVFGLSGVDSWNDEFASELSEYEQLFVIFDNDSDYMVKGKVDQAYLRIRRALGGKVRRIYLPNNTNDLCDFFDHFGIDELRALAKARIQAVSRFQSLDLTKEPPPMNWLVENWIARGDTTLIMGDPGLGKSWLTMDLAVAVAGNGQGYWLGHPVLQHGRVLYIDEENPEDLIFHRFRKLGLSLTDAKNIRYIHRPGIWLNKDPHTLLQEALEFQPQLIVLDSLATLHSEDENNAVAMTNLFKEAINPLARETGSAVVCIHHSNKGDGNSYQRSRGSGGISAAIDSGLDVRGTRVPGLFTISNYKSRRVAGGTVLGVRIEDAPDGTVRLTTNEIVEEGNPF